MTIETVDPEKEAEALGDVLHACVLGGAGVNFILPFSVEAARAYWRVREGWIVLAAREGERIVGTVSLIPAGQPNQPHRADVAKMLVHPDMRRRGIGRALMVEVEDPARRMGRTLLTLDTEDGSDAESLYLSMGYVPFGTVPDFALKASGDAFVAATFYTKRL